MIVIQEYLGGGKIKLEEVGPFVYEEKWVREEVEWLEENTAVKFKSDSESMMSPKTPMTVLPMYNEGE